MTDDAGWGQPGQEPEPPHPGWAPEQPPPTPLPAPPAASNPTPAGYPPPGNVPPPVGYPPPGAYPGYLGHPGYAAMPPPAPKPGVIPLRPLGIGEILDGAIQSVRRNPKVMLGLSAVVVSLTSLITFALTWSVLQDLSALDPATASTDDFLGAYASLIGGTIPGTIVGTIAQTILIGVLTVVVGRAALGQTLSIGEAWTLVRPRLVRLLGLSLVATVGTWGLLVLSVGGLVALSVASTLWLLVLLPVAVLPAIFVYVMWWIASPALVLEKAPIFGSLGRSWTLVKGAWWRTFLIVLLTLVLTTVITSVISVPFQLLGGFTTFFTSNPDNPFEISVWGLLVQSIGQIIGLTITYPFTAAVTVLVYIDRRMRVEGLDLELARAASAPGPVGPSAP